MLVILAAVSISAVYNSNIVNYAVNGATNYASEATRENEILDQTASIIQDAVDRISDIAGGSSGENPNPGGDDGEDPVTPPDEPEPGIDFGDLSEDEMNAMVGKYVDYTPTSGSFTAESQYSGYDANQNFSTATSLKWRILDASDNTLTLISDTTANSGFTLGYENGYNNGVKLLNDACYAMYSNSSLGAVARSVNIEDIEAVSSYNKNNYSNYGKENTSDCTWYPNIFKQELNGAPGGIYGTTLKVSEQTDYVTGRTEGTELKGKNTYYTYTMSTDYLTSEYLELFAYQPETTKNLPEYWLASRFANYGGVYDHTFVFGLFTVYHSKITSGNLFDSLWDGMDNAYAIRPVVEIDLSKVNVGLTGDGGVDTPYSIEAK